MYKSSIIQAEDKEAAEPEITKLKQVLEITSEKNPDLLVIDLEDKISIGIEVTKSLKEWSKHKPYQAKGKLGIIYNAQALTLEAQNSILKILEEPEEQTMLVLVTNNHKKLLDTVVSRCAIVEVKSITGNQISETYQNIDFDALNTVEKFLLIDKMLKTKDKNKRNNEIEDFLRFLLLYYRDKLFHDPSSVKLMQNIELLHETVERLRRNVNKKLTLENLIINLQT